VIESREDLETEEEESHMECLTIGARLSVYER
jgi:hypothetical protein